MGTTSQTTISSSSPLSPDALAQRLVESLRDGAEVTTEDGLTTLAFPPRAEAGADDSGSAAHLLPGAETLVVDCTAPSSGELSRLEDLLTSHLRAVDPAAASAVAWRRHE